MRVVKRYTVRPDRYAELWNGLDPDFRVMFDENGFQSMYCQSTKVAFIVRAAEPPVPASDQALVAKLVRRYAENALKEQTKYYRSIRCDHRFSGLTYRNLTKALEATWHEPETPTAIRMRFQTLRQLLANSLKLGQDHIIEFVMNKAWMSAKLEIKESVDPNAIWVINERHLHEGKFNAKVAG